MAEDMVSLPIIDTGAIISSILLILIAYLFIRVITFILVFISERAGQYRITVKMVLPLLKFSIYGITIYYI